MSEQTKCPECGAYSGHGIECERKTPEEWREAALFYHRAWLKIQQRDSQYWQRWSNLVGETRKNVTFWQGKCAILKSENNALRKKLKNQVTAPPTAE